MVESVVDNIKRVSESDGLTNILLQFEDFLDGLDLYAFANWFEGEIVSGPIIKRHWVSITLRYPKLKMPDPEGGLRLIKYGAQVKYRKHKEIIQSASPLNAQPSFTGQIPRPKNPVENSEIEYWLVYINLPRRFIADLNPDLEADQLNDDNIQAAKDEDIEASDQMSQEQANSDDPTQDEGEDTDTADNSEEEI